MTTSVSAVETTTPEMSATASPWKIGSSRITMPPTTSAAAVRAIGRKRTAAALITAAALVVGGIVILLDPIFQGLAVALISGVVVSTALTLVLIPLLYYMYVSTVGIDAVVRHDDPEQGGVA